MKLSVKLEVLDKQLAVIRLSGVFEGQAVMDAEAKLAEAVKKARTFQVWLDFSQIEYIDSMAVSVLLNLMRMAVEERVQLSLYKPNEKVKMVLSVTHVNRLIPIIEA